MAQVYGKVNDVADIRRINCLIRDEMLAVETPDQLTDLKKRSDYLCTLTYSPFWKKHFGHQIDKMREVACEENRVTVQLANYVAKSRGWDKSYSPWGKDRINLDDALKELPEEVIREVTEGTINLKADVEALDQIRQLYCDIRKAMVVVDDAEELLKLKRASDMTHVLVHMPDFACRFGDAYKKVVDLVHAEEERTVTLANLVAEVHGWQIAFECWGAEDMGEDESIEAYLKRLEEEERKASQYIPTEVKYKEGKVLWLVYYKPSRKRWYAKRIYFPGSAKDIQLEGPGEYKNRFGRTVWGVKITYKALVAERVIHRHGKVIRLPETWVTREKVVPLPRDAEQVSLQEERPPQAMSIA